jgi:acetoin utilization deacetylase AcuC-like enzyme
MSTLLFTHEDCLAHDTSPGHPERADRLRAILKALEHEDFAALERREAPLASREQLLRAHPERHVDKVFADNPEEGYLPVDGDTIMSPGTLQAALRAAGGVVAAVDAVAAGEARNAFCAVRPPGHHAEPAQAMGFCFFNNVVVGALHARAAHGLHRVAIVDFDVHHGNGTQSMCETDPELFYGSTHQMPLFPGTGYPGEGPLGNIVNVPLAAGTRSHDFREAFDMLVLPALQRFEPQLLMISAGFDAHARDPLAEVNLTESDFAWATEAMLRLADRLCGGRVVSTLEGGYDLEGLATSTAAHLRELMRASGRAAA